MSLGSELRAARTSAGISLAALGERVGVSAASLSRWENGRATPGNDALARVAGALGLPDSTWHAGVDESPSRGPGRPCLVPGSDWRNFEPLQLDPVLAAALRMFLARGYHGTTVRDVAKEASMSVPNVYHYYASKQALLVGVMDRTMVEFRTRCELAHQEGRDATERFELLVECFALFHSYRRELAFIGASEMRSLEPVERERIAAIRSDCQRMIDIELEALDRDGRLRTKHRDDAGRAVVTMLVGIANWYDLDGRQSPDDIARRYVEFASELVGLVAS